MIRPNVTQLNAFRSTLHKAAAELLRADGDRSAAVMQVRDAFPGATVRDADRMLRDVATQMVVL